MWLKSILFIGVALMVFQTRAQSFVEHSIQEKIYFTRVGLMENISYQISIKQFELGIGTGFNLLTLVNAKFYAPHINLSASYLVSRQEKLKFGLGLNYIYNWRINKVEKHNNTNELFYHLKLIVGKKWRFVNQIGVGALFGNNFPDGNIFLFDYYISVGLAYAF